MLAKGMSTYLLYIVHPHSRHNSQVYVEEASCRPHQSGHSQHPKCIHNVHCRCIGSYENSGSQDIHWHIPHHCSTQAWVHGPHSLHWCS